MILNKKQLTTADNCVSILKKIVRVVKIKMTSNGPPLKSQKFQF